MSSVAMDITLLKTGIGQGQDTSIHLHDVLDYNKRYAMCRLGLNFPEDLLGALFHGRSVLSEKSTQGSSEPTTIVRSVSQTQ